MLLASRAETGGELSREMLFKYRLFKASKRSNVDLLVFKLDLLMKVKTKAFCEVRLTLSDRLLLVAVL